MSVQSNTYVLVGVMLDYDDFTEEQHDALEPYRDSAYRGIEHHNGLCAIVDGMGGEYVAIGRVVAKSDDQNGNYGMAEPVDATGAMTDELRAEVAGLLAEHFDMQKPDVRVWVFTNYR